MVKVNMRKFYFLALLSLILISVGCSRSNQKDVGKVINLPLSAKVKGMDPIYANDLYSGNAVARVYEGLLSYHYLKRPFVLEPNLAAAMPEIKDGGLTYIFKLKRGVLFHDNPCFKGGKGREMVAEDVVYSFKRTVADPRALGWWVVNGKLAGFNEFRDKVSKGKATLKDPLEGVKALDSHTVQFKLVKPFPQFIYSLAMPFFYVVPREAVEHYGAEFLNRPVGTGPFMLERYDRTNRTVFHKNPKYRRKLYPSVGEVSDREKGLLADAGKPLPFVDKLVVHTNVESQPRWLSFHKGKLDLLGIPKDNFDTAVTPDKELSPEFKKRGIRLDITSSLDVTYTAFQHSLKLFDNVALRRALSLAYDAKEASDLFYSSIALPAQSIIPPGISGFIKNFKNPWMGPNIKKAKELLVEAGYPEGKGLSEITLDITANSVSRQIGEFFRKRMALIGVKIKVVTNPWPELQKKIETKRTMLHALAWGADYPDAENFLQLLYGPNSSPGSNGSNYKNEEFDKLFEQARLMQDSPKRTALYEKMYQLAGDQVPWIYGVHRQRFTLVQGWLKNFKSIEFDHGVEQYYNVDIKRKQELLRRF